MIAQAVFKLAKFKGVLKLFLMTRNMFCGLLPRMTQVLFLFDGLCRDVERKLIHDAVERPRTVETGRSKARRLERVEVLSVTTLLQ